MTIINPPEVRLPLSLQISPEAPYHQSQSTVLYQLWDALRKLGTSSSTIINDTDFTESFVVACSDETSGLAAGTAKASFRMPYDFTITDIRAAVNTAPTGTTLLTVDVGKNGTSILYTKLTFDAGEVTTTTAVAQRVITDTAVVDDDLIRFDIISVGNSVAGAGLKVSITGFAT